MRIVQEKTLIQISFLPRSFPVNCYLVEEEDGMTLIDTALPYSAKKILRVSERLGKPIKRILLTHAHDDHVGGLDALKQVLPDVPVYISARDARLLTGDRALVEGEPGTPIRGGVPRSLKTKPDELLKDGDRIGSLMAITTPGHTPGSMSFIDTRHNFIIAGDAFQTRAGLAVSGQLRILFPFPAMATWNKRIALESALKIKTYQPSLLAVGHGRMLKQPNKAIEDAISEAKQKLNWNGTEKEMES
ncbi:MAG: MBL fold metallo-hydrolase [Bacillaceae bacterium]|nr:MBL fold metallo-hydrolase [Bacillaceae bacterium]